MFRSRQTSPSSSVSCRLMETETEDQQVLSCVRLLQQQLARSIEVRNLQDCHMIIDKLAAPPLTTKCPNSLNWYLFPQQQSTPFLHAVAKGHEDIALLLLQRGCDPHSDCSTVKLPGMKAADVRMSKSVFKIVEKPGFERLLRAMLEQADKLIVDKNGDTVLHVIAKKKLCPMLEVLISSRWLPAMLQHCNNQGFLPMHVAASCNFLHFFLLLFPTQCPAAALAQVNTHGSLCPAAALTQVNTHGSLCPAAALAQVNTHGSLCPAAALTQVNTHGSLCVPEASDLMENMLAARSTFNVNAVLKGNRTSALHLCASARLLPMVELLIQLGANVNAADFMGKTPLVECLDHKGDKKLPGGSACDLYEVCRVLLQAGANVNVKSHIQYSERRSMANDDILTPLHLAASIGCSDVVELLLNNGADPRQLSGDIGKIPLQFALELGHNEAALTLLSPDLYPEGFLGTHCDYAFNSLLHSADRCSPEVIRKLIDLSCPLDRPNVNHLRPLDKALSSHNTAFVELLLDTQPRIVNVHLYQDPTAYPPLHLAASSGSIRLCQILLSYGADIYSRAYGKHMAYRKAFKFNRYHTAVYLCEQMSRPFSPAEKEELQSENVGDAELARRLQHRLQEIPTLVSTCLDTIRRTLIQGHLSFKDIDTLPVPETVIKALRYQNTDLSMSE